MNYNIKLIGPDGTKVVLRNVGQKKVMEATQQAAGKNIDVIVESAEPGGDCPCKFHLGCLTPNLCN